MVLSYLKISLILLAFLGTLIAPSSAANATKELCDPSDKRALLRIKQQLINTTIRFDTWDPATDCCNWIIQGVFCDPLTNRVNSLWLIGADAVGPQIPSAIADLPFLDSLILDNNFSGPIPGFLAKLRRLGSVDFSSNLLTGPIPSFFGTFPNLTELQLNDNLLTGAIPLGLAQVAPISHLDLSNNKLTGTIPESLGSFKSVVQILISLANNRLSGEIPRSFDKNKFWALDFSENNLEGDASFLFSKDKTFMAFLNLSYNSFSFDMTNVSIAASVRFPEIDLAHNNIYGSLPEALAHVQHLSSFNVSYNQLCGRIPAGALKMFNESSYLHNKCLCGHPLPHCRN